jgi:hypothetical protein
MQSVLDVLDDEWRELARSPRARRRLRQWGHQQPALACFHDLHELLEGRQAGPGAAQTILLGLARLAPHDELAARTLLQALIPGIVRLATTKDRDDPMAREELVAIAWVRIRTYPTTRFGSVAANVLRDTQKQYRAHRKIEFPKSLELWTQDEETSPSAEYEAMNRVVLDDLVAAKDRGLVSDRGLGLVLRSRLADTPLKRIAAEEGVGVHVLVMRRWREEQRLRCLPLAG